MSFASDLADFAEENESWHNQGSFMRVPDFAIGFIDIDQIRSGEIEVESCLVGMAVIKSAPSGTRVSSGGLILLPQDKETGAIAWFAEKMNIPRDVSATIFYEMNNRRSIQMVRYLEEDTQASVTDLLAIQHS